MKQKAQDSNFETKRELKKQWERLENEIKRFDTILLRFQIKMIADWEVEREQLKDRETRYHSEVMTAFDKIVKKLDDMEQDRKVGDFQVDERLGNHEERIQILESSQKAA